MITQKLLRPVGSDRSNGLMRYTTGVLIIKRRERLQMLQV